MTANRGRKAEIRAEMARTGTTYNVARRAVEARAAAGFINEVAAAGLPTMAPYPGPSNQWHRITVGLSADGNEAIWDVSVDAHALLVGPAGSGKSVIQRSIALHALTHREVWKIVGIDLNRVELAWLSRHDNVLTVADSLGRAVDAVESVRSEMFRRFEEMTDDQVRYFTRLSSPPPAILLLIDEAAPLFAQDNMPRGRSKHDDELRARAAMAVTEIVRLGRAAGIHVVIGTQMPTAGILPPRIRENLNCRIAAGRLSTEMASLITLDSPAGLMLPTIKGRGMIRVGSDEPQEFHAYYAPEDWLTQQVVPRAFESATRSLETLDPFAAMPLNQPPGILLTGAPGSGKSVLSWSLADNTAADGGTAWVLDLVGEGLVTLPRSGALTQQPLRDAPDGALSPFALGEGVQGKANAAIRTAEMLLGGPVSKEREEALAQAAWSVARAEGEQSLSRVVDLLADQDVPAARNMARVLRTQEGLPWARLVFPAPSGHLTRTEAGRVVAVTLAGLPDLPPTHLAPDEWGYEQRLAMTVVLLTVEQMARWMYSTDGPVTICIEQADLPWRTAWGLEIIGRAMRHGRWAKTAVVLSAQSIAGLPQEVASLSPQAVVLGLGGHRDDEAVAALALLGGEDTAVARHALRDLRIGEGLMRDLTGEVKRTQFALSPAGAAAFGARRTP